MTGSLVTATRTNIRDTIIFARRAMTMPRAVLRALEMSKRVAAEGSQDLLVRRQDKARR